MREAMSLGDTPLTGNGFVQACRIVLGYNGWGDYIPCSLNQGFEAEERICAVINARHASANACTCADAGQPTHQHGPWCTED